MFEVTLEERFMVAQAKGSSFPRHDLEQCADLRGDLEGQCAVIFPDWRPTTDPSLLFQATQPILPAPHQPYAFPIA